MKRSYLKEIMAIRGMGQVISVTAALTVMIVVFGIINPTFFSGENTTNLLRQVVPIMIIGIASPRMGRVAGSHLGCNMPGVCR